MKLNLLTLKEVVYFSQKEVKFKHFEYFFGKKLEKYQFTVRSLCLTTLTISIHVNLFAQMM